MYQVGVPALRDSADPAGALSLGGCDEIAPGHWPCRGGLIVAPVAGWLVLFPSHVFHDVAPTLSDLPRISIDADMNPTTMAPDQTPLFSEVRNCPRVAGAPPSAHAVGSILSHQSEYNRLRASYGQYFSNLATPDLREWRRTLPGKRIESDLADNARKVIRRNSCPAVAVHFEGLGSISILDHSEPSKSSCKI